MLQEWLMRYPPALTFVIAVDVLKNAYQFIVEYFSPFLHLAIVYGCNNKDKANAKG